MKSAVYDWLVVDVDSSSLSVRSDGGGGGGSGGGSSSGSTMSSTLVETVSINYDDFSDSFLTCGTCLCVYDGLQRVPKLLACSHTVCQSCLEHILDAQLRGSSSSASNGPSGTAAAAGSFRCPICRETITVPRGGVAAFPPSFIVNQVSLLPSACIVLCPLHYIPLSHSSSLASLKFRMVLPFWYRFTQVLLNGCSVYFWFRG